LSLYPVLFICHEPNGFIYYDLKNDYQIKQKYQIPVENVLRTTCLTGITKILICSEFPHVLTNFRERKPGF